MKRTPPKHNPAGYPNVTSYLDRHGKRRWRYRKGQSTIQLGTDYGSPEFLKRLENARKGKVGCRVAAEMPQYDKRTLRPTVKRSEYDLQGQTR